LPRVLKKVQVPGGARRAGHPPQVGPSTPFIPLVVSPSNHAANAQAVGAPGLRLGAQRNGYPVEGPISVTCQMGRRRVMGPEGFAQRVWMRQWRDAGPALAAVRRTELMRISNERALAASEALLSLVAAVHINPRRLRWSGLVEQQAVFHCRPTP
jgi:hypothetical protein